MVTLPLATALAPQGTQQVGEILLVHGLGGAGDGDAARADGLPEPTACRVEVWRWNAGLSGADVREQVLVGLLAEVRRYGAGAA